MLENIAYQEMGPAHSTDVAERFLAGWLESPPHLHNLLNDAVTETGVGIATDRAASRVFAVQMFARPKSAQVEFTIENRSAATIKYEFAEQRFDLEPGATRVHFSYVPEMLVVNGAGASGRVRVGGGQRFVLRGKPGDLHLEITGQRN